MISSREEVEKRISSLDEERMQMQRELDEARFEAQKLRDRFVFSMDIHCDLQQERPSFNPSFFFVPMFFLSMLFTLLLVSFSLFSSNRISLSPNIELSFLRFQLLSRSFFSLLRFRSVNRLTNEGGESQSLAAEISRERDAAEERHRQAQRELREARVELEKVKSELAEMNSFVDSYRNDLGSKSSSLTNIRSELLAAKARQETLESVSVGPG